MLPKSERLDTKRFDEIIASGRNINAGGFYFRFLSSEIRRFSVVVPKKVTKSAIKRHFLKRKLFKFISQNKDLFPVSDYILFVNKDILEMTDIQIQENIKNVATKLASN